MRNRFHIYLFLAITFHFLFFGSLIFISSFWWNKSFLSGGDAKSLYLSLRSGSQNSSNSSLSSSSPVSHPTEKSQAKTVHPQDLKSPTDSKKKSHQETSENSKDGNKEDGLNSKTGAEGGNGSAKGSPGFSNGSSSLMAEIRNKIERAKRYPALARARKIEGVVSISFLMDPAGKVQTINVVNSSGSSILDEEALAAVKRAAPFPYYAKPLSVSLRFNLKNE